MKEKNLKIAEDVPDGLPKILVDPHKTTWILNNFLTNAIRYTPVNSSIRVLAELTDKMVRVKVIDAGPGISAENQSKIFKKFSRVSDDQSEGTGLGLAISKEFIEAMGGNIGVNSKFGEGAEFWVDVPVLN